MKVENVETGEIVKIRLFGVDTPEGKGARWEPQPYSKRATEFVRGMFDGDGLVDVAVFGMYEDKYGRTVAGVIKLHDGRTVQDELMEAGLAWVYGKYCPKSNPECKRWLEMEAEAREAKRGLWKELDTKYPPVAPWVWRNGEVNE